MKKLLRIAGLLSGIALMLSVEGAGLLTNMGEHLEIDEHRVNVTLNNGFARTEVKQVFVNRSSNELEAIYTMPIPDRALLSELSLIVNGEELIGEVVPKKKARALYESQKAQGNDAALAEQLGFKTYRFQVGRVPAEGLAEVRFVYYQPLEMDHGVGRYVYPMSQGGTDSEEASFWNAQDDVFAFSFDLELKSAFPVAACRMPNLERDADIEEIDVPGKGSHFTASWHPTNGTAKLNRDIVFYYRLKDGEPGRVELIPYRSSEIEEGSFMAIISPAADLQALETNGSDWIFVLDVSGSMQGPKLATLAEAVGKAIGELNPQDRFSIITFSTEAKDLTKQMVPATEENITRWTQRIKQIRTEGGTSIFAGLKKAYRTIDPKRSSGIVLITDGVITTGPREHQRFLELLDRVDVRLFTIIMGNSANRPLLEELARDSDGFAITVSANEDLHGRLLQVKRKLTHQAMHDVEISFDGVPVRDITHANPGTIYRGEQLIVFGRYPEAGPVEIKLKAKISGEAVTFTTEADLPSIARDHPEIERLWAASKIEESMREIQLRGERQNMVRDVEDIATEFSLVTDYTSMLVMTDEQFETASIQRRNASRISSERTAQTARNAQPPVTHQVGKKKPMFKRPLPSTSNGSGPIGPLVLVLAIALSLLRSRKA